MLGILCAIGVSVINNQFAPCGINRIFDHSEVTSAISDYVEPNGYKYMDVDFGCEFQFTSFEFVNEASKQYAFGTIVIQSAPSIHGPYTQRYVGYRESMLKREGKNAWRIPVLMRARFVRFVFMNDLPTQQRFEISDLEAGVL